MIEFTIKTLDSIDHEFSVEDEITVQQLKEKVLERMGIETGLQRLIFCGRVLQDENKLSDYGVNGKVVHMVQRAPPCVEARQSALRENERERERETTANQPSTTTESINLSPMHFNQITQQQIRRLMALAATAHGIEVEEQPGPNLSPTASRLEFLRRLISEIRTNLDALKASESDEPSTFSNDDPLESTSSGDFSSVPEEVMCHIHQRPLLYQIDHGLGASRQGRGRRIRSMRAVYHTPPRDFGQLVEELHELDGEFAPFREIYINTLREASDPEINLCEDVLQRRQRTADLCAELYHTFSHAYHTVSDVGLLMAHGNSRLTSEALMRHPLPVHAHINVVQASPTRRPPNATTSANGLNVASSADGQEGQSSSAPAGRNSTQQSTVQTNVQPDPVTYQVEIETAVPIPINIENGFINGTNSHTGQNQQTNQQPSQNSQTQDGLPDRRQVMIEVENLFRGLGQAGGLGGVEVVMSMEEIPQVNGGPNNNNTAPTMGSQPAEGGVYLAQTADLLHNIVASVFRQGLLPGTEGVVHAQVQQIQGQNQAQSQGQSQGQNQTQSQGQSQTQSQSQPQTQTRANQPDLQNQSQLPNQAPNRERLRENQGGSDTNTNAHSGNQQRQQNRNRVQRVRSQTVSIFNLVYDRFLPCDSQHARQQLQRRREESILSGGPRLRDNSSTRIQNNVETLFERFDRNAVDEESLMIAAMVTLREATSFSSGRTLVPEELLPLRQRLQVYMRDLMQGEYEVGTQEQLADLIFERHSGFIDRILSITPMRQHIDVIASMKAVFIRFLNEAMTVLDLENNDVFSRRFRIVFPRMFYELCGVISYCCSEGVQGLRKIYRSFVTDLIQNVDEPVRDLLHSLAMENLNAAIVRVEANKIHYPQFIRRKDQQPCSSRSIGNFASRYYGMLRSIESPKSAESSKAAEADGPADAELADETEEIEEGEDAEVSGDTEEIEEPEEKEKLTPMELSPQAEPMQTSPPAPESDTTEIAAKATVTSASNTAAPPVSTGTYVHVKPVQTCAKAKEEISSARNDLDNESTVGNCEPQECVSATNKREKSRSGRSQISGATPLPDPSDNIRFVPPAQIAQHWGEEWVPTFTHDLTQQSDSDEPYSDAYLSGMPPKKRRRVRQSRPPTTINAFFNESVNAVAEAGAAPRSPQLTAAFQQHVGRMMCARAAASRNFDPVRYGDTARFLNQSKANARKTPKKSD